MNNEKDIEQLFHQLQNDQVAPPEGLWNRVEGNLSQGAPASQGPLAPRGSHFSAAKWIFAAASVIVVAGAAIVLAVYSGHNGNNQSPEPVVAQAEGIEPSTASIAVEQVVPSQTEAVSSNAAAPAQAIPQTQSQPIAQNIPQAAVSNSASNLTPSPSAPSAPVTTAPAPANVVSCPVANQTSPAVQPAKSTVASPAPKAAPAVATNLPDTSSSRPDSANVEPSLQVSLPIPNLITPNNDGYNDCWVIPGIEQYRCVQVQIFAAGGKRVYESSDYHNQFCGQDFPDGEYFYVLRIPSRNYVRRGNLTIKSK